MAEQTVRVGLLEELDDPGCREFSIGNGDFPLRGFVVRQGDDVFAYQNSCVHAGLPLNWAAHKFLSKDKQAIICAAHGASYDIRTGRCFAGPGTGRELRKIAAEVRAGVVYVTEPV